MNGPLPFQEQILLLWLPHPWTWHFELMKICVRVMLKFCEGRVFSQVEASLILFEVMFHIYLKSTLIRQNWVWFFATKNQEKTFLSIRKNGLHSTSAILAWLAIVLLTHGSFCWKFTVKGYQDYLTEHYSPFFVFDLLIIPGAGAEESIIRHFTVQEWKLGAANLLLHTTKGDLGKS